jgi:predicted transcriptional regulator
MKLPPISRQDERRIVGELYMLLGMSLQRMWLHGLSASDQVTAGPIMGAVLLGHLRGKPITAHKIALYLSAPRTTVLRKLDLLVKLGHVEKSNSHYVVTAASAAHPPSASTFDKVVKAVIAAGAALQHVQNGHKRN